MSTTSSTNSSTSSDDDSSWLPDIHDDGWGGVDDEDEGPLSQWVWEPLLGKNIIIEFDTIDSMIQPDFLEEIKGIKANILSEIRVQQACRKSLNKIQVLLLIQAAFSIAFWQRWLLLKLWKWLMTTWLTTKDHQFSVTSFKGLFVSFAGWLSLGNLSQKCSGVQIIFQGQPISSVKH